MPLIYLPSSDFRHYQLSTKSGEVQVRDLVELRKVVAGKNDDQIRALVAELFEAVNHG